MPEVLPRVQFRSSDGGAVEVPAQVWWSKLQGFPAYLSFFDVIERGLQRPCCAIRCMTL